MLLGVCLYICNELFELLGEYIMYLTGFRGEGEVGGDGGEVVVGRRRAGGRLDVENLADEDIDGQDINVLFSQNGKLIDDELRAWVNVYFSNELLAHEAYQIKHGTNPDLRR